MLEQIARHTPEEAASLFFFAYQAPKVVGMAKELEQSGVPLYCYDKPAGYDLNLLRELISLVRKNRIQTIHTHDFGPMEYAVALKIRFPRIQLVHTHHSLHYFLRFRRYIWAFRLFSLFYSRIICVSDHVREELSRHCPTARRKLLTINNGVNVSAFDPVETKLSPGPLRIVNVSRLSPEKNVVHTLLALKRLKGDGVEFEFHHAGSGDVVEEKKLQDFVEENGLSDRVHFHGFQTDVRKILELGDVFVTSSKTEGHPVAVLEAMASGKICLCSDIAPHRLLSKESILFFNLEDDSLATLLKSVSRDLGQYSPLRVKAREEVAQKFSLERMIGDYLQLYVANRNNILVTAAL